MANMGILTFLSTALQFFSRHDDSRELSAQPTPSMPVMKHRACLPMEIVIQILKEASVDAESRPDYQTLSACALVCKDWSVEAQRLLFNNVVLGSQSAFVSFQAAVDRTTARGCVLGGTVQTLTCVLDPKQPHGLSQSAFACAVTSCPNLREVDLAVYDEGASEGTGVPAAVKPNTALFHDSTIDVLLTGPQISALKFSNCTSNSDALAQLLDVWPTLTSLSLAGTPPRLVSPTTTPYPGVLEKLSTNFQPAPCLDFMKWLLHNSQGSLRILQFDRQPALELFGYLLSEHGQVLESLSIPTCASREGAAALSQCAKLRQLHIENAWTAPSVHRSFPPLLGHIAMSVDYDTNLQPLLQTIKKNGALNKVTLHVWPNRDRNPQLSAIHIACAVRGVELDIVSDIRGFRALHHLY